MRIESKNSNIQASRRKLCGHMTSYARRAAANVLLVLVFVALSTEPLLSRAKAESTNLQRFEFTEKLENSLQRVALQILRSKSGIRYDELTVTASMRLDDEAISQEFLKERKDSFANEAEYDRFAQRLKETLANSNESNSPGSNANGDASGPAMLIPQGARMGPLNLDVLAGETIRILDKSNKQNGDTTSNARNSPSVILALQLPQLTDTSNARRPAERVDISAFILAISANISVPSRFEANATAEVKTAAERTIRSFLPAASKAKTEIVVTPSLPSLQDKAEERAAKLAEKGEQLPPPAFREDPLRYLTENILDPKNPTLSGLLNALFMLVGLVLASIAVIRASGKLAGAITAAQEKASASTGDARDDTKDILKSPAGAHMDSGSQSVAVTGRFDQAAEARALTSEMARLRELFHEAVKTDLLSLQEALGDLLRNSDGFATAVQCASFVDHHQFNPLTERLSPKLADDLRAFMLENSNLGAQTLGGADGCRSLIAQWNLRRIEVRSTAMQPEMIQVREAVLMTDDNDLFSWLEAQSGKEAAYLVFRNLTQNRMVQALRRINSAASSAFARSLDIVLSDFRLSANEALRALRELKSKEASEQSGRTALIRKMLTNLRIKDEEMVINVLEGPDWELRRLIASKAFLFSDLGYLEPRFLLGLLEKYKTSEKTSVFYLLPTDIRNSILRVYPEDSKSKEVLLLDLKVLESNRKRFASVVAARDSILETFMTILRGALKNNPDYIANALRAQASARGWALPADLEFAAGSAFGMDQTDPGRSIPGSNAA
jgi:hypothetical protein